MTVDEDRQIVEYQDRRFRIVRDRSSVRIELRYGWTRDARELQAARDELDEARAPRCMCCVDCMGSVCHPDSELECWGECERFNDLVDGYLAMSMA